MPHKSQGLTLIEVLVALAIIGISLTAVIKAASENIRATAYLQTKTIALWVGQEIMSEVQVGVLPLEGNREDQVSTMNMLGQDWYWRATEKSTANTHIKQIRVRVYEHDPEDEGISSLIDLDGYRYNAS
jgi:general secretion pathway protein I